MAKITKTGSSGKKKLPAKNSNPSKVKKSSPATKPRTAKPLPAELLTESKYKAIVEQASDPLFIHDLDGRIVEVNEKACKSLGYTREELLSLTVMDIEQNFDLNSARKEWQKISDGVNFTIQGRQKRKDGTIFPVEIRFGVFTQSGKRYIIGFVKDITEEIKEEEKRKKTETQYRLTLDSMLEGAQIIGFDWKYIYINNAAERQNKRPKEELLGKVYADMWPGVEKTELYTLLEKCMYDRVSSHFENFFVFPDGSEGWYELSIQPVPEGIFILSFDITDRKITEEKYRESREQFYAIYQNSLDAILVATPGGTITAANEVACKLFGMSEEEICKVGRKGIVDWSDSRHLQKIDERDKKGSVRSELTFVKKDGTKFEGELSSMIFKDSKGQLRSSSIIRDISERKEYEQKLVESETHFRTLADSGQALIWTSGTDKKCDYFNKPWLDFTGRKLEQELGDGWAEGVHPDDLERCVRIYTETFDKREKFSMEYRIRHNSGEYRWILDDGCPRYNSRGEFIGYIGFCLDVTNSRKAIESLTDSEKRFRNVFELASFGMVMVNKDMVFTAVNGAFCRMTGYSEEELKKLRFTDITHPDDVSNNLQNVKKLIKREIPVYKTEKRFIRKDGTIIWAILMVTANFSSDGEFLYNVATLEDITERKTAEESLKSLADRLKLATDSAKMGIWDWDIKNNILEWDDTMYNLYGVKKSEFHGAYETWLNGLHPDDREASNEVSRKAVSGEMEYDTEFRIVWPDGSVHWIKADGEVFRDADGSALRMVGVNYDISERKKSEQELVTSEKRYRYLFDNNPLPMWIYDLETLAFLEVNAAAIKHYGYTRDEFLNMTLKEIRPSEDIAALLKDVEQTTEVINFAGQWRHKKKNGEIIFVEIVSHQIEYNDKKARLVLSNDITEKVKTQNRLIESEERFRQIADTSGVWVWEVDKDGLYTYVSGNEQNILGYPVEEVVGKKRFYDFFIPEIKESLTKAALDAFAKRQVFVNFENPNIHKDGHTVYLETSGLPMFDKDGNFTGYRGADRDITRQHLAVEALKENEASLQQAQNIAHLGNWDYNIQTNKVVMSAESFEIFELDKNIPPEELFGEIINSIFPEERAGLLSVIDEIIKTGLGGEYEYRINTGKGKVRHIYSIAKATKNKEGEVIAIHGVVQDITKSKHAEEEIKKLSRAMEQSPASVVITNLSGNIEYVNPKFTEITEYSPEEVIGKNPRILKSNITAVVDYDNLWKTIKAGNEWKGEFYNKKKSGENYWVSASISAIRNVKGDVTHYLAVEEDITEKKKKELELIEAKNTAEEMNRLKSNFLANMSHELRTPMVAILGFSEILLDLSADADAKNYADMVHKGATRLMETLNLILNLSLIEAENLALVKSKFDIVGDIEEIMSLYSKAASDKNLYFHFERDCASRGVITDRKIFREVMSNILNNAVKFTETGGISVRLSTMNLTDSRYYEIRVRDTGIGIPSELHDVIFEEYRQVSEGYSRTFEGTGLGLTVTKKFINKIGGDIVIEDSEPETGTVFLITLPAEDNVADVAEDTASPEGKNYEANPVSGEKNYNVLYVEDDEMSINLIKIYLKDLCNVDSAENGLKCISMASKNSYNAILVDINLGRGADGLETAAKLRTISGYENVPIIAVTAFAMEGDKEEFLQKGCTHYISKPFKRNDLVALVKTALEE